MRLTSLQVCMDSSDWLQGTIHEETGMDMDSSSSPSGDMQLTCSARAPLMMDQRRLMMRPPHDQALKCPRCESTHTKFCYYNNYSLSQPRYFCKTCRRYWTKGGTLRNIPVGGGCRKNKKVSSKKSSSSPSSNDHHHHQPLNNNQSHHLGLSSSSSSRNPTDLQLSFPQEVQFPQLSNFLENTSFMESKYCSMVENPMPFNFMGSTNFMGAFGDHMSHGLGPNFHPTCSPFAMSLDGNTATTTTTTTTTGGHFVDACQRLMLPNYEDQNEVVDVKPNTKLLSLDQWQDQGCTSDAGRDSLGYINGLGVGSWTGLINGYGTSTTNPLV